MRLRPGLSRPSGTSGIGIVRLVAGSTADNLAYTWAENKTRAFRYHLTSDDVRGGLATMRAAGIQHERRREATKSLREQKRATKAREAFRKMLPAVGVWVSFEDSQKVGNCASGTISWGGRTASIIGSDTRTR